MYVDSYPPASSLGGVSGGQDSAVDRHQSTSLASLRLLAKEHQLQTMLDVKHAPATFLR